MREKERGREREREGDDVGRGGAAARVFRLSQGGVQRLGSDCEAKEGG